MLFNFLRSNKPVFQLLHFFSKEYIFKNLNTENKGKWVFKKTYFESQPLKLFFFRRIVLKKKEQYCSTPLHGTWGIQLEEETATHSSALAWKIPRTEESGGLQSTASRVRNDCAAEHTRRECRTKPCVRAQRTQPMLARATENHAKASSQRRS